MNVAWTNDGKYYMKALAKSGLGLEREGEVMVMMVRRFVVMMVCFGALVFFAACKNGGGSGGAGNSASALTADQFAVAPARSLSNDDFTGRLKEDTDFMWDDSQVSTTLDTCIDIRVNAHKFTRNDNNTFTLAVNDTDFKSCMEAPGITVDEATFSIFIDNAVAKDDAGNIVDLSATSTDVLHVDLDQYTMKARFHFVVTGVSTGRTIDTAEMHALHAVTGFNDPCLNEGADNCRWEEVAQVHRNFSSPTDYIDKTVLESHGLGVVHGAPYFAGGTMTFTFNNWNGTMTYNSSALIAPAYTATNGIDTLHATYTPLVPPFRAKGLKGELDALVRSAVRKAVLTGGL